MADKKPALYLSANIDEPPKYEKNTGTQMRKMQAARHIDSVRIV
jgi:hypothetical protein